MENSLQNVLPTLPTYLLFLTAGLTIYGVTSWLGGRLLNQIETNKTSVFGRSNFHSQNVGRTLYIPPAQTSTVSPTLNTLTTKNLHSLPSIPMKLKR